MEATRILKFQEESNEAFAIVQLEPDKLTFEQRLDLIQRIANVGSGQIIIGILPRSLCARIAARFNWVKAKENDEEFRKWLENEAGVFVTADEFGIEFNTKAHEQDVSRMADEGCPH